MLIISHRGKLDGEEPGNEPLQIERCIAEGFQVEVDLFWDGKKAFFGHDGPTYPVVLEEWDREDIFFHLKTPLLPDFKKADAFGIDSDPFVLTLRGYVWTNYGTAANKDSIVCSPELVGAEEALESFLQRVEGAAGICTDFPREVRRILFQEHR
jgi:hypothetical protein